MVLSHKSSSGNYSPVIDGQGHTVIINEIAQRSVREVTSISKLIGIICSEAAEMSKSKHSSQNSFKDLNFKVDVRFEKYKVEIKQRFARKHEIYAESYEFALEEMELTDTNTIEIRQYLEDVSTRFLNEEKDDPIKALDRLVEYFEAQLSQVHIDEEFSRASIEYYLLKQLLNCNVFPNPIE